jgi:hypothetical protein
LYAAATQSAGSERDCPSEAVALAAFLRARAWLDADALPAQSEQAAQLELADTAAVCVILRHAGRVVGYGEDAGEGGVARSDAPLRAPSATRRSATCANWWATA